MKLFGVNWCWHAHNQLNEITEKLDLLMEQIKNMTTSQAQLDAGLATLNTNVEALVAAITQFISDYSAKTGVDLTNELSSVTAAANSLQTSTAAIVAADPAA
jgi:chromosome segregation ATPase